MFGGFGSKQLPGKLRVRFQSVRQGRGDCRHPQRFRRLLTKGNAQPGYQQQRKCKVPKDGFRLAKELAAPQQDQLHQRMITHPAGASR